MQRREFLFINRINEVPDTISEQSTLDSNIVELRSISHLLRRIAFQPKMNEIIEFSDLEIVDIINKILGDGLDYLPENFDRLPDSTSLKWLGDAVQNPKTAGAIGLRNQLEGQLKQRYNDLIDWILNNAKVEDLTQNTSSEKFTYFLSTIWNIEFTYDSNEYLPPNLLFKNNDTLRKHRFGNYKEIAKLMTLDGAFLLYQSLNESTSAAPNENYARELLELFTMGIGNYTEGDIQEISRVFTGWRTAQFENSKKPNGIFNTWFDPDNHDLGSKQVMGHSFPARNELENNEFKVRDEEIYKLIDILFERRGEAIAKYVCEKIYRFFVYSNLSEIDLDYINELAITFQENDFELLPVYKKLFASDYFYQEKFIGVQFKSPYEYVVSLERLFNISLDKFTRRSFMSNMEQNLYDPPNVSGWTQYRTWISTTTFPFRVNLALDTINKLTATNVTDMIKTYNSWNNFSQFIEDFLMIILPKQIDENRKNKYIQLLLKNGVTDSNWSSKVNSNDNSLVSNFKKLLEEIVRSPDFQLC